MRDAFIVGNGLIFFAVGYVYPFVVVFRGGTLNGLIGKIWLLLTVYFVFISMGFPRVVNLVDPVLAVEVDRSWVPETTGLVPIMFCGWMIPACSGGAGYLIRHLALKWFPSWMQGLSRPSSTPPVN